MKLMSAETSGTKALSKAPVSQPMKDPLWKVYEGGRLRRIYAIETDDAGDRTVELLTWFGDV